MKVEFGVSMFEGDCDNCGDYFCDLTPVKITEDDEVKHGYRCPVCADRLQALCDNVP